MSEDMPHIPGVAEPLYGVPLERFVAERNALAKKLAAAKDPSAEAVRKLTRPTRLASAIDRLARARPALVRTLLDAGEKLRRGQRRALSGGGAEALREGEAAVRDAARALRNEAPGALAEGAGKPLPPPLLAELELALRVAATGTEDEREALRRGVLAREPERSGFGELAGLTVVHAPSPPAERGERAGVRGATRARGKEAEREPERANAARVGKADTAAAAERLRAERDRARAEKLRARRERAARAQQQAEARAEARARSRSLAQVNAELRAAEIALRRLGREAELAERRAADARERKDKAERALAELRARVEALSAPAST